MKLMKRYPNGAGMWLKIFDEHEGASHFTFLGNPAKIDQIIREFMS